MFRPSRLVTVVVFSADKVEKHVALLLALQVDSDKGACEHSSTKT
jgi:hypothetical protein